LLDKSNKEVMMIVSDKPANRGVGIGSVPNLHARMGALLFNKTRKLSMAAL
jgi:hypothetical protein